MIHADFPVFRARRMRRNDTLRQFIKETELSVDDFIYPIFIREGIKDKAPIESMPGIYQLGLHHLQDEIAELKSLGIKALLLFGIPLHKDYCGSEAYSDKGIIQQACRLIRDKFPDMLIITDVCLCEYTDHGHCGLLDENGVVKNDETCELLACEAVSHARAGADMVAPSDMMDGDVAFIRKALDEAGFSHIPILSYSTKYASGFYGPFRDAADSAPSFGDRRSYQMDCANSDEGLREAASCIREGADMIMVKPALSYLDVIERVKSELRFPLVAYNVSGEYSMVKAAAERGWIDEKRIVLEILTSIKRAGADMIITYHAKDVAQWLNQ